MVEFNSTIYERLNALSAAYFHNPETGLEPLLSEVRNVAKRTLHDDDHAQEFAIMTWQSLPLLRELPWTFGGWIWRRLQWRRIDYGRARQSLSAREVQVTAVMDVHTISLIFTTLQYSPDCQGMDFSWVYGIYRKIRKEPESALKGRRRQRFIAFEKLARVPEQMLNERVARQRAPVALAWRIHDELLLSFLILAQYPPRFVREAGLGTNVFKGRIPKIGPFNIPSWAEELLREDSDAEFWQFRFESKQGQVFRGLILRRLLPLLELYMQFRPLLIRASKKPDPGTMFFSRGLTPLSSYSLGQGVVHLMHRYTRKCVTPTAIRSSFAYHWRAKYSSNKDAVLANIQWVQYPTIKMRYDEKFRMEQRARVNRRKNRYM
jgi:hypothetical protein